MSTWQSAIKAYESDRLGRFEAPRQALDMLDRLGGVDAFEQGEGIDGNSKTEGFNRT